MPITLERYRAARERLIQGRATHLHQLGDKLREARVRPIVAALQQGLEQTAGYARQVGADEAYLVLFERRQGIDWDARIWLRAQTHAGREIGVWGA